MIFIGVHLLSLLLLIRVVPDTNLAGYRANDFTRYRKTGWPDIRLNSKYNFFQKINLKNLSFHQNLPTLLVAISLFFPTWWKCSEKRFVYSKFAAFVPKLILIPVISGKWNRIWKRPDIRPAVYQVQPYKSLTTNLWLVDILTTNLWLVDILTTKLWLVDILTTNLWLVDILTTNLWLVDILTNLFVCPFLVFFTSDN